MKNWGTKPCKCYTFPPPHTFLHESHRMVNRDTNYYVQEKHNNPINKSWDGDKMIKK